VFSPVAGLTVPPARALRTIVTVTSRENFRRTRTQTTAATLTEQPIDKILAAKYAALPSTAIDGRFSIQYTMAVALLDGGITVDSFNNELRFAADVVAQLPKITLRFDDDIPNDFDRMQLDMTVTLNDGRILNKRGDKFSGWIRLPLTREQRLIFFTRAPGTCSRTKLPGASLAASKRSNSNPMLAH